MVSLDKLTEVVASNDKSKIEELVEEYSCMTLQEQKALLDSVKTAFAGSVLSGIYILTYLLYIFKDEKIIIISILSKHALLSYHLWKSLSMKK